MAADDTADRYPDSEGPFAGPNNTFPLNTEGRVRNAWARIHQAPTMANHSADELAGIKAKIQARAKELGITLEEHSDSGARSLPPDQSTIERRAVLSIVELRSLPEGDPNAGRVIGGYAAKFDRESRMISNRFGSPFVERIARGFFDEARSAGWPGEQGGGVLCRFNHSDMHLIGTVPGTCQLEVDNIGLEYRTSVPRCRDDVLELIDRGDVKHSSYTFMDAQDDWTYAGSGICQRTLVTGGVLDVAPVSAVPAYQDTSVGLRSLAAHKEVPVDDVYALAHGGELRKLFIRTDQALAPPAPTTEQRTAEQLQLLEAEPAAPPAPPELPAPPATADEEQPAAPESPPLADEPPATLSWQEAHLRLYELRPFDPITH